MWALIILFLLFFFLEFIIILDGLQFIKMNKSIFFRIGSGAEQYHTDYDGRKYQDFYKVFLYNLLKF